MNERRPASSINWEAVWQSLDWGSERHQQVLQQTLAQRAEKYARPAETDELVDRDTLKALVFTRGPERYGIPVAHVVQGLDVYRITPLPCAPAYYRGVINLRGRILSVFDLRRFWGLPEADPPGPPRLVITRAARRELALLADDILRLATIPTEEIVPPVVAGITLDHVQGVSPEGVVILDMESLFADRRLIVHEEL